MTGLGARLKEARTEKGYSLEDLQSITKIQKRYLSGIENEDYSMMPGAFYVRAFIKQYAEAVGLDADEMLLLYKESGAREQIEEDTQNMTAPMSRKRKFSADSRMNEVIPKIIVALFVIVIIGVVWFLWQKSAANSTKDEEVGTEDTLTIDNKQPPVTEPSTEGSGADDEEDSADNGEETEEPEPVEPEQVIAFDRALPDKESFVYTLTETDTFILRIETKDETWIAVTDQTGTERTPRARIMTSGESVELDVSDVDSVRIRVGRSFNTDIYVNDEKVEYESDQTTQNIIIEYNK